MSRSKGDSLLLGEWACLGILSGGPSHGFAIAARLRPTGDVGRVWSQSRPLVYRSLEQLVARGFVRAVGEEPGIAGGNRTVLAITRTGRAQLRRWLAEPVTHLRDLRSELLLKLVLAQICGIDPAALIAAQRAHVATLVEAIAATVDTTNAGTEPGRDVVALWRHESSSAALRFLDRLVDSGAPAQ